MVKTILHKVTESCGAQRVRLDGSLPPRDADPAPIIYAYVELNLQSMPDAPGVPRHFEPLAKPETPVCRRRAEGGADAADDRAYARDRAGGDFPRSACGASHAGTRARGGIPRA